MTRYGATAKSRALLLLFFILPVILTVHLMAMAEHSMGMLGACLAVLQAVVLLIGFTSIVGRMVLETTSARVAVVAPRTPIPQGRHPPGEGTVLRD